MFELTGSMIDGLEEFITLIVDILNQSSATILDTAFKIDEINFENSIATDYLGYFHWIVGTTNYTLFTTILLISAGVTLWTTVLKGIGFVRSVTKWW